MKTLIAEDDTICRTVLQKLMAAYGPCQATINGREALAAVRHARQAGESYDLICLDILMPEMDGQATLKAIRADEEALGIYSHRGVKIIMTTALDDAFNIMGAFYELCDGYLVKPIDLKRVKAMLEQLKLA